jgi:UDP-N-acetylenolpyruvoylglucosamine reductase
MSNDNFVLGDSNAICDECGWKYKRSQLKKRWDGLLVCAKDYEERHEQDSIKIRPERNNVKDARTEPSPHYVAIGENTADKL